MTAFSVKIYTFNKIHDEDIVGDSVFVPTVRGELNLLEHHTHIFTQIESGVIRVFKDNNLVNSCGVQGGICKVLDSDVVILAETIVALDGSESESKLASELKRLESDLGDQGYKNSVLREKIASKISRNKLKLELLKYK